MRDEEELKREEAGAFGSAAGRAPVAAADQLEAAICHRFLPAYEALNCKGGWPWEGSARLRCSINQQNSMTATRATECYYPFIFFAPGQLGVALSIKFWAAGRSGDNLALYFPVSSAATG